MTSNNQLSLTLNDPADQVYYDGLPHFPYAANGFDYGVKRYPRDIAATKSNIQHNPELMARCLVFDVDRADAFHWWQDCLAPAPNYLIQNPTNGHAHYVYMLASFVAFTDMAKPKPKAYLQRVERGLSDLLQADTGYSGLMSKNPLNNAWTTYKPYSESYSLGELADYVNMDLPKPKKRELSGVGRNCHLFDELRYWAYKHVVSVREQFSFDCWLERCITTAERMNTFNNPLAFAELKATAKSVAKWTWSNYTGQGKVKRGRDMGTIDQWQGSLELRDKQQLSAQKTNEQRKQNTERKIKAAIAQLQAQNKRVTQAAVSRISGISKVAINKYYKHLFR